eukprot:CAMPEP_0170135816 /NCGR_PEP_ID=MMETSP0033_2-20121228/2706_1 /TAXON_ID=195969 /ORGANISM="Dolichomastix tenuilepis, Strain CCMP3274" /LENGTH=748 /DNA_ID=CAMNT_0010371433 /DNA_START=44 /DNA_END=2287 /DNA_ORIENTATION=-
MRAQLVDAALWADVRVAGSLEGCDLVNRLATRAGFFIICAEPLAALAGACVARGRLSPPMWAIGPYAALFIATSAATVSAPASLYSPVCGAPQQTSLSSATAMLGQGSSAFARIDEPRVCSIVTPQGHILYGGLDTLYTFPLTVLDNPVVERSCLGPNADAIVPVRGTPDIPMLLRIGYLAAIALPFLILGQPRSCGIAHAGILAASWMSALGSDSFASMWCFAAVAQSALMLLDPVLWPDERHADGVTVLSEPSAPASPAPHGGAGGGSKRNFALYRNVAEQTGTSSFDAIVIGSGIGGLTCAGLLAKAGKRVCVLEQHYRPGGCTHSFTEVGPKGLRGDSNDSGIHYVGAIDNVQALLKPLQTYEVAWAPMGNEANNFTYDAFDLGDGRGLVLYSRGFAAVERALAERWPEERKGIRAYFEEVQRVSEGTDALVLAKLVPQWLPFADRIRVALLAKAETLAQRTATEAVSQYVEDPALRAILSAGQMIDWNLVPSKVSFLVAAGMANYYRDGGFYPVGGSNRIVDSMLPPIRDAGGGVFCKARVDTVLIDDPTNAAVGVRLCGSGEEIRAPIVIAGCGFDPVFRSLLPQSALMRAGLDPEHDEESPFLRLQPSHSHVCCYVSLDGPSEAFDLAPHNVHSFAGLADHAFDVSELQNSYYCDPLANFDEALVTITSPSAKDPEYPFADRSNVIMLAEGRFEDWEHLQDALGDAGPNPHGRRSQEYTEFKRAFEPLFLSRLYKRFPRRA